MTASKTAWCGAFSAAPALLLVLLVGQIPGIPVTDAPPPATPPAPEGFPEPGPALFEDLGTERDAAATWGAIDCEARRRHRLVAAGGAGATDAPQAATGDNSSFRRLRLNDGDDFFGERCELGLNDHREGPTALYREGERVLTFLSLRLPPRFPLGEKSWQVVMQMKQSQPSNAGGGPPVLAMHARAGRWRVTNHTQAAEDDQIWAAPARRDTWVRFAFDVLYSVDPELGSIRIYADLNGDGDVSEAGERSPRIATQTLKREVAGSDLDDLTRGDPIPSHLRVGLYHDPAIGCRAGRCRIDVDNVGVYQP